MTPLSLTMIAAASTFVGGYSAALLHRRIHLLIAFGAGVLVGAALFDLLPSALSSAAGSGTSRWVVYVIAGLGGLAIYGIGQVAGHSHGHGSENNAAGKLNAALLIVHSALDGTAIFAASTVSVEMGLIVGMGVVAHDACDGLNTILLSSGGRKPRWSDFSFLAMDAAAPVAGGLIAAHLFTISRGVTMFFLSLAAGSFLFTALFSLVPEAWRSGGRRALPWLALGGTLLVFGLTRLLGSLG